MLQGNTYLVESIDYDNIDDFSIFFLFESSSLILMPEEKKSWYKLAYNWIGKFLCDDSSKYFFFVRQPSAIWLDFLI